LLPRHLTFPSGPAFLSAGAAHEGAGRESDESVLSEETREAAEAAERSDAAAGGHPGTETETGTGTDADADADADRYRVFRSLVGDVSR
jgi:hypothetical protein